MISDVNACLLDMSIEQGIQRLLTFKFLATIIKGMNSYESLNSSDEMTFDLCFKLIC